MPRFLAVYTMKPEDLARFRARPKAEQKAVDDIGLKQWADWERRTPRRSLTRAEWSARPSE